MVIGWPFSTGQDCEIVLKSSEFTCPPLEAGGLRALISLGADMLPLWSLKIGIGRGFDMGSIYFSNLLQNNLEVWYHALCT
jgi:hypothetical protein